MVSKRGQAEKIVQRYGWQGLDEYLRESRFCHPHFVREYQEIANALTTFSFGELSLSRTTIFKWCKAIK